MMNKFFYIDSLSRKKNTHYQHGASLIIVMLILVVVSILGVGGVQIVMMAERGTRNDRDMQIAWQAAEAALIDAEFDIGVKGLPSTSARESIFSSPDSANFPVGCGNSGQTIGLCSGEISGKPAWITVDFTATDTGANTVIFGAFTGRQFPSGAAGVQPAKPPRYVIERIIDPNTSKTKNAPEYMYRVTAMGFGPNANTQAVLQMVYRN